MVRNERGDRIRTVELSDPELECESLRFLTMYSPALGRRGDLSIFAPPELHGTTSSPIVLLLHGVYGSHWSWFFKGAANRIATDLIAAGRIRPMLLVAPSDGLYGDGSGYICHSDGDYEAWITTDVLECVRSYFPCIDESSSVFIAGLSMGGYGALRLGAKHPALFRAVSAHSAITHIDQMELFTYEPFPVLGIHPEEMDLLYWMEKNRRALPCVRFDCGIDDPLVEGNRRLHRELNRLAISHEYEEREGAHTWTYWRSQVAASLLFFEATLRHSAETGDPPCKPDITIRQLP